MISILVGPLCGQGEAERAARLWGASENLRRSMGGGLPHADKYAVESYVASVKRTLDKDSFDMFVNKGEAMSLDEALAYVFRRDQGAKS